MRRAKGLFLGILWLFLLFGTAAAWETAGSLREWDISPFRPFDVAVTSDGRVWLTYRNQAGSDWPVGKVLRFNPADGSKIEIALPPAWGDAGLQMIERAADDSLWITDEVGNRLVRIITAGGAVGLQQFPLPGTHFSASAEPFGVRIAPDGSVWFTCWGDPSLGRYDPATGDWDRFEPPGGFIGGLPVDIAFADNGIVWFSITEDFVGGEQPGLGRLNPGTGSFTLWTGAVYPGVRRPWGIVMVDGVLWFLDHSGYYLVRFDPSTSAFTRFAMPTFSDAHLLVADPDGTLWMTAYGDSSIYVFNTKYYSWHSFATGSGPMGITIGFAGDVWWAETYSDGFGGVGRFIPKQVFGLTVGRYANCNLANAITNMQCLGITVKAGATLNMGSGIIMNMGRLKVENFGVLIRGSATTTNPCFGFLPPILLGLFE